jgi:hypothetical protein
MIKKVILALSVLCIPICCSQQSQKVNWHLPST